MDNNYIQNQQVNQKQQVIQVNQQQNVNEQVESTIFDKHMQMNEQYMNDRKRNGEEDSEEMRQVKSKLSEISSVLGAQMSENEHDFRVQITVLKDHYAELLLACDTYLATKKWAKYALFGEAKRRRNMVIAIKKMAQNEADCLSGLSKDKELHSMRVEGMLVGNALSSALRDYQAVKEDIDFSILRLEGQDYVRSINNDATDLRDNVIVNREAGKMTDDMKNVVCTNRLAQFIGMDGICSRSTLVMSKDEEQKYHYGLKNEGQPDYHKTLAEIKIAQGRHPYKISYSGEALKQISNARLFHMLLGGNSLKAENDLVMIYSKTQMGEETTYHITGAYLDTNKEKFSDDADTKSMGRLLNKGDFLMTDAMAQSILNLEPGDIEYVAGEMLSNDKKKAFAKRVNFLKNWVRAKKEEEAQTGPSRILSEEAWKEEENLEEIRDRITVAGNGFYLGILKNNSYVEETDGENRGQYEKDYQKLYKKIKRSLEDAKDIKTRIYIIGTLPELNKIYEKKYVGNEGIAKEMVDDIQSRFLSDYVNDEFIEEYYNELWRVKKELAEAYNKEITKNPNNGNAAYEAVNQNRTLYRNLTILTNLSTSWLNGNALGRDLRMNKLGQYVLDVGQKHKKNLAREAAEKEIGAQNQDNAKKSEIQEKYNKISEDQKKDADTVDLIISKFQNLENGNHSKVFDEQIDYWLEKDFLKNPIVGLGKKFLPKKNQKPSMFGKEYPESLRKAYDALEEFKNFELPQPPVYEGKQDDVQALAEHNKKEKAYQDEIINTGLLFMQFYVNLGQELEKYSSKNKDKKVEDYLKKIDIEKAMFSNMVSGFLAENKTYKKNTTWNDIIKRGIKVNINISGLKNMGGGTSEVYKVTDKNGTVKYFKPKDVLQKNQVSTFAAITRGEKSKILADNNIKDEDKKVMSKFLDFMEKNMLSDYKNIDENILYNIYLSPWSYFPTKDFRENTRLFYKTLVYGNKTNDKSFENVFGQILELGAEKMPEIYDTVVRYLHANPDKLPATQLKKLKDLTVKILTEFTFKLNQFELCTKNAKIKPGNNTSMTMRNVGTSRLAGLLGIRHLVAHSEATLVKKGNGVVLGNIMEEAKGKKIKKVSSFNRYSKKAVMDINTMLIFDMIYGQIDRHEENFHYITHNAKIGDKDKEVIDSVHMIDNDMGGGNITVEDIKKGTGVAEPFDPKVLEAIPNEVKHKIRNLDIRTVSLILGDILSKQEIEFLGKRLKFIQDELKKIDTEVQKLAESDDVEKRFEAFLLQDDNYRVLIFEKSKLLKSKAKKDNANKNNSTFISITASALPSIAEINNEIRVLKEAKREEFLAKDKK